MSTRGRLLTLAALGSLGLVVAAWVFGIDALFVVARPAFTAAAERVLATESPIDSGSSVRIVSLRGFDRILSRRGRVVVIETPEHRLVYFSAHSHLAFDTGRYFSTDGTNPSRLMGTKTRPIGANWFSGEFLWGYAEYGRLR